MLPGCYRSFVAFGGKGSVAGFSDHLDVCGSRLRVASVRAVVGVADKLFGDARGEALVPHHRNVEVPKVVEPKVG